MFEAICIPVRLLPSHAAVFPKPSSTLNLLLLTHAIQLGSNVWLLQTSVHNRPRLELSVQLAAVRWWRRFTLDVQPGVDTAMLVLVTLVIDDILSPGGKER